MINEIVISIVIAFFVILTCTFSKKDFFFFDDAQNLYLSYYRGIGRIWLKKELPFIVQNTFFRSKSDDRY